MAAAALLVLLLQQIPVEAGTKKLADGDFEGAVPFFTQAIELKSDLPAAYRGRAEAWFRLGEFDKAAEDYGAAQKLAPDAETLARRGLARLRSKGPMVAAPDFDEALTLNSRCALAVAGQAAAMLSEGRLVEAERGAGLALSLAPELPEALYLRSRIHSVQGNVLSARHDADRAIAKDPFHVEARRARVDLLIAERKLDDAVEDLDMIVKIRPKSDEARALRGNVQVQRRQFAAALEDLSKAVELNPASADHLLQRASLYRRQLKDAAKSVPDYTRALALAPTHKDALTGRGYAYARLKNWRAAARDLARACELDDDDPWGPYNLACFHGLHAAELEGEERKRAIDAAFRWLHEARDSGYLGLKCGCHASTLEHLRTDADLDPLHDDKRWAAASRPGDDD